MDKLKITLEHYYTDNTRGFYCDLEIPVTDTVESREILREIKKILSNGKFSEIGDSNTEELSAIFGVTQGTIMNWVRRDGMPIVLKTSKGYRFNKEEVFDWVRNHKAHYIYLINRYLDRVKGGS
jgi:hypothetical protein